MRNSSLKFEFSGKIACANVLSDLYALGATECDNMLMLVTFHLGFKMILPKQFIYFNDPG
jgi:hypothetical protein